MLPADREVCFGEVERWCGGVKEKKMEKDDYLEQLKGCQQLPGGAVPPVNLVVLELRREPRGPVVLVTHLDGRLCKRPTDELGLALNSRIMTARRVKGTVVVGGGLDTGVEGAVYTAATWCQCGFK